MFGDVTVVCYIEVLFELVDDVVTNDIELFIYRFHALRINYYWDSLCIRLDNGTLEKGISKVSLFSCFL